MGIGTAASRKGALIVNADDWGRDALNTDRTLDCFVRGTVTAVSAMVFMEDSERAADIAREKGIDVGLHLNFTTRFSGRRVSDSLVRHLEKTSRYLGNHRLAQVIFHPGLASSFRYLVESQLDEFGRIYGTKPKRLDGHHHMHLCANVLFSGLLPYGTTVRRNFSFLPGEKSLANRTYRRTLDAILARHHNLTDYFFSLPPLSPVSRLQRIFALAKESCVEVETHPVLPEEYAFLTGNEALQLAAEVCHRT
jgi:predicted glycoside hydrolase/deacetylase ChbG (UPF0249 family)